MSRLMRLSLPIRWKLAAAALVALPGVTFISPASAQSAAACDAARQQGRTLRGCPGIRRPPVARPPDRDTRRHPIRPAAARTARAYCVQRNLEWVPPDLVIRGCTTLIQSGRRTGADLSESFNNRGLAYHRQGDYARAIADYGQAIGLNPQYAVAYNNRGLAYYYSQEDYVRAIADFDQAIRLDPQYSDAYAMRGNAYLYLGDIARAETDFAESRRLRGE